MRINARISPEQRELEKKTAKLSVLEVRLAERELDLATLQNELRAFEARYFRSVGTLFAELDDLEAQIVEADARRHPQDQSLHERAAQARAKASESAQTVSLARRTERDVAFEPSQALKQLYREIARRIHPDLSTDERNRARRTRLMAEANKAYADRDEARLHAILDEWENSPEAVEGEGVAAELVRTIRKIHQVEGRLSALEAEMTELRSSDLWQLSQRVRQEHGNGRDVLAEMANQLETQVAQARSRLAAIMAQGPVK